MRHREHLPNIVPGLTGGIDQFEPLMSPSFGIAVHAVLFHPQSRRKHNIGNLCRGCRINIRYDQKSTVILQYVLCKIRYRLGRIRDLHPHPGNITRHHGLEHSHSVIARLWIDHTRT